MKKLKIISALSLVALLLGESAYALVFTGPGRRAARRNESQNAYKEGVIDGKNMANEESYTDKENYADDANVTIQSLGDNANFGNRQMNFGDGHLISQLSPEEKQFIMQKISERRNKQNVTIQAIDSEESNAEQEQADKTALESQPMLSTALQTEVSAAIAQAYDSANITEEHTLPTDVENVSLTQEVNLHEEPAQEKSESSPSSESQSTIALTATTAVTEPANAVEPFHETEFKIATEQVAAPQTVVDQIVEQSHQTEPVVAPLEQSVQEKTQEQPVLTASTSENIKIVKVYPVYDAITSGIHNIKNAAIDMLNYVHAWAIDKLKTK